MNNHNQKTFGNRGKNMAEALQALGSNLDFYNIDPAKTHIRVWNDGSGADFSWCAEAVVDD